MPFTLWRIPVCSVLVSLVLVVGLHAHAAPHTDLEEGIAFVNPPVPQGATDPAQDATHVYVRAGSENARVSPVDITLEVFDKDGKPIHQAHKKLLTQTYKDIYGWTPKAWRKGLQKRTDAAKIVETKSNFFWESLAQHMAERLFGENVTDALYLYGPDCVDDKGKQTCPAMPLKEAHTLVVTTQLDGARDPLNSVSRSIVTRITRGKLKHPDITLTVHMPCGLQVASPHRENLDFRPTVGTRKDAIQRATVTAHIPSGTRERFRNLDYPDYSLLYVPLRHLVFQGDVSDPKQPGSSLTYPDRAALQARFDQVVSDLRTPATAANVVAELNPFFTPNYYYMFDGGEGVEGYRNYLLGPHGILKGLSPDFGKIELEVEWQDIPAQKAP